MKKVLLLLVIILSAVVTTAVSCEKTPYYNTAAYHEGIQANRRTEIVQGALTERTDIRESGRTERAELAAQEAEHKLALQRENNAHDKDMFTLRVLSLADYGNDNLLWIAVSLVVGAVAGWLGCEISQGKRVRGLELLKKAAAASKESLETAARDALDTPVH